MCVALTEDIPCLGDFHSQGILGWWGKLKQLMFVEFLKVLGHGEICSNKYHVVFVDSVVLATIHVLLKKKGLGVLTLKKKVLQLCYIGLSFWKNVVLQNEQFWLFSPLKISVQSWWLIATFVHFTFISVHSAQHCSLLLLLIIVSKKCCLNQ